MATDIRTTLLFAAECRSIADSKHGDNKSAIQIRKEVWAHCNTKPDMKLEIYCTVCGQFFNAFSEFCEKHGGE